MFTTTKFIIIKYLKINKKKPKMLQLHGYYFINKLILLQCEDIELNPGPMPDINPTKCFRSLSYNVLYLWLQTS